MVIQERKLTIPTSPNLATRCRVRNQSMSASSDDEKWSFKAQPVPDMNRKFVPKHDHVNLTEPEPFHLSTEDRHRMHEEQMKRRMEEEEEKQRKSRVFKANPVRSASELNKIGVGSVEKKSLTEPKPFNLRSETRHEHFSQMWEMQVEKDLENERAKFSSFTARTVPKAVTDSSKVFTPRRASKPLTEVREFDLNVDRRGEMRKEFEKRRADKEAMMEAEKREEERRRQEEEQRELKELRQSMTIKARPVPESVYTAVQEIQRSTKPLTEPISPHFRTDMRLRSRV